MSDETETKTCRACAEEISIDARRCPHCTAWNDPRRSRMIRGWIFLAVVLVLGLLALRGMHQADVRAKEKAKCQSEAIWQGLDPDRVC